MSSQPSGYWNNKTIGQSLTFNIECEYFTAFKDAKKVVTSLYCTDTSGSAGVDEVTSGEGDVLREVGNESVGRKYHVAAVSVLHGSTINL